MRNRVQIGLDLDGVIRDFIGKLNDLYDIDYPEGTRVPVTDWDISKAYSIGREIFYYAYIERGLEITRDALPYEGALEFYYELLNRGDVWIVSNQRNKFMQTGTAEWIARYLSGQRGIIYTGNKNLSMLDVLIDDYPKNLTNFHGDTYCIARPWNKDYRGPRYDYELLLSTMDVTV
jgi:5'(3')-deoxyribonucleotidase